MWWTKKKPLAKQAIIQPVEETTTTHPFYLKQDIGGILGVKYLYKYIIYHQCRPREKTEETENPSVINIQDVPHYPKNNADSRVNL